jgi:hypothetical protein
MRRAGSLAFVATTNFFSFPPHTPQKFHHAITSSHLMRVATLYCHKTSTSDCSTSSVHVVYAMVPSNLKAESWDSFHKRYGTRGGSNLFSSSCCCGSISSYGDEPADSSSWFSRVVTYALLPHDRRRVNDSHARTSSERQKTKSGQGVKVIRHG